MVFRELQDNALLNGVGVLILIHEDELEPFGILPADILVLIEERIGKRKQVVEIHRISLLATVLVVEEDLRDGGHLGVDVALYKFTALPVFVSHDEMVLGHGDTVVDRCGLIDFLVESHLLDNSLQQRS